MFDIIKDTIEDDLIFKNKTEIIFLLVFLIFLYFTRKHFLFMNTLYKIIVLLYKKSNDININLKKFEKFEVVQISNNTNNKFYNYRINNDFSLSIINIIRFVKIAFIIMFNHKFIKINNIIQKVLRLETYNQVYSVIKYPNNFKQKIPDKFILLINHTHIYDDVHIGLNLSLFPDHEYVLIVKDWFKNDLINKISHKLLNFYHIKDAESMYSDINKILNNNKKIIIIIFPEGILKIRTTNITNYDINKPSIENFKIIEEKCFNYKKGAFHLSIMNNIPILQTIYYSPMPNYKYNFFGKEYDIKHINHIGINIYKFQKFKKGITIENYRKTMEKLFRKRYINTLINAHRFNIIVDK